MKLSFVNALCLAGLSMGSPHRMRARAGRFRSASDYAKAADQWKLFQTNAAGLLQELHQSQVEMDQEEASLAEMLEAMAEYEPLSMLPTDSPTKVASVEPTAVTAGPTISTLPSSSPSNAQNDLFFPTASPSTSVAPSSNPSPSPTLSSAPSQVPSPSPVELDSAMPSSRPSVFPSNAPTAMPSASPTRPATQAPTQEPSAQPTESPSSMPSPTPTRFPSSSPTTDPSSAPTSVPTAAPSPAPSTRPTESVAPSDSPTLFGCRMTPEQRSTAILALLDTVADPALLRDPTTPQGLATEWIIGRDARRLCPDDDKLIQRWALAVMYYSTGGDSWLQCFEGSEGLCGSFLPFLNEDPFLSPSNECEWAGISCNAQACVTEIEFEENNLVGTIPTEMGLFTDLAIWGMERGGLQGTIPTEIGQLGSLIFLDLDFNLLTGTLPTELYTLTGLTQLDLNNNLLFGNVNGIGSLIELEFLQLHINSFTGNIPDGVGNFSNLATFTLHETFFSGVMPDSVCALVTGGGLTSLIADCEGPDPDIGCSCCTDCRDT